MSKFFRENNRKIIMIFIVTMLLFGILNIQTIADNDDLPDLTIIGLVPSLCKGSCSI